MLKDSIKNIFNFISESNLTEKYFYENKGKYPVYSGQTENEGIVASIDSFSQEGECVTFTTYGVGAGKLFYRNSKYTVGRNCMGLKVKKKYKDQINLKWFSLNFQNFFYRHRIGDSTGQRSLNKTLIENLIIQIPKKQIQENQLYSYEKVIEYKNKTESLLKKCYGILETSINIKKIACEEIIENIFHIIGGNTGLTENFIYHNLPTSKEESILIFSGSTQDINSLGSISKNVFLESDRFKIFKSPSIIIVRKGLAGRMTNIKNKDFTINDDAYALTVKKEWKDKINPRWFAYRYQELFYNLVTSKSDNATFNKEYIKRQKIKLPLISVQNEIADKLEKIDLLIYNLKIKKSKLEDLLSNEMI